VSEEGISNVTLTMPQRPSFNAVYGRIGRSGSEEVILQLIRFKCMTLFSVCFRGMSSK